MDYLWRKIGSGKLQNLKLKFDEHKSKTFGWILLLSFVSIRQPLKEKKSLLR